MSNNLDWLMGTKLYASSLMCEPSLFVRWKRVHRRPRIQKRWRRFGAIYTKCAGRGYHMAGLGIVGCPHWCQAVKSAGVP